MKGIETPTPVEGGEIQGGGGALGARIPIDWESSIGGMGWIALFIYFWLCWVFIVA